MPAGELVTAPCPVTVSEARTAYVARHGEPPTKLELKPGEYMKGNVRVAALAYE